MSPDADRDVNSGSEDGLTWSAALEAMPDAVLVVDDGGIMRDSNSRAVELVGRPAADLVGQSVEALVPERLRAIHRGHVRRFFENPEPRSMGALREITLVRGDGSECHVDVSLAPVRVDGRDWVVASLRDVSEYYRLRAEALLAHRAAEAASEEKSRFLARMSHELRTPLNAMLGFAQLMELDAQPSQRDSLVHIRQAGRHLLEIIGEVLDISRVESGALGLSTESVVVSEVVDEVLDLLHPIASERGVRLDARSLERESAVVVADRQRVRQILMNLVSNAVKYNRIGGRVTFTCNSPDASTLRIDVADTGVGIAESDLSLLFQPFERLAAAETDIEGTGIGLALSQHLATAMNGHLEASSVLGEGSVFSLVLPSVPAPSIPPRQVATEPTARPGRSSRRTRLLYIEDNLSNVRLLEHVLSLRPSWTLTHVGQGREGLELIASGQVDVLLLDVHLPDMSGEEVLASLRAVEAGVTLPVVVLSADAMASQIDRMLALGATHYVTKPFDVTALLDLLDSLGGAPGL